MIQDMQRSDVIIHSRDVVFHAEDVCRVLGRQRFTLHQSLDQLFEDLKALLSSRMEKSVSDGCLQRRMLFGFAIVMLSLLMLPRPVHRGIVLTVPM